MKISTKGRYATRAMLELALRGGSTPILLKDISARQNIPLRYLEQIVSPLIAAGLIHSTRGRRGGVLLAKKPAEIRLIEIVQALEGPIEPVGCVGNPGLCTRAPSCATRDVWSDLAQAMRRVLEGATLQDLVERQKRKETGKELVYDI